MILSNALGWLQFLTQKWQSFPGKCLTGVFICQEQKTSNNLLSIPLSCNLTVAATSPLQKSYLRFFPWHVNRFNTFPRISGEDSLANITINSWWYFTRSFTFTSQLSGLCILLYASTVITTRPAKREERGRMQGTDVSCQIQLCQLFSILCVLDDEWHQPYHLFNQILVPVNSLLHWITDNLI